MNDERRPSQRRRQSSPPELVPEAVDDLDLERIGVTDEFLALMRLFASRAPEPHATVFRRLATPPAAVSEAA